MKKAVKKKAPAQVKRGDQHVQTNRLYALVKAFGGQLAFSGHVPLIYGNRGDAADDRVWREHQLGKKLRIARLLDVMTEVQ